MLSNRVMRAPEMPGLTSGAPQAWTARRTGDRSRPALFNQPLTPILAPALIALLVLVSIKLLRSPENVVVFWPVSAVGVIMWLRCGRGQSYDLAFGALMTAGIIAGEFLAGYSPGPAFMLTFANMTEMVVGVILVRRFAPGQAMSGVASMARLGATLVLGAPLISALVGAVCLNIIRDTPILVGVQMWWFGHALGMLVLSPLLLSINGRSLVHLRNLRRLAEAAGLLLLVGVLAYALYIRPDVPLNFLIAPVMVVVAVRLRAPGVAIAALIVVLCVFYTLLNHPEIGLTAHRPLELRLVTAQLSSIFQTGTYLLVAALLNERDQLSARARAGQARAEQASEAKSRLLANVAHEIKSPVAGVIGIGELWSSSQLGPITPTQREMADMLVKTARQVETLAHDLLDVARAESGSVKVELRPTDVTGLVEDVRRATVLRPEAGALKIEVISEGEGLVALADSQRLSQVVDNLATNAVKYGGVGGSVIFRILRVEHGIRVEVTDKGPGLSVEKQAQLFEPFNRLGLERSAVEGHGIGLALARRLVELQAGTIGVISAPGEGCTFWIELPAA